MSILTLSQFIEHGLAQTGPYFYALSFPLVTLQLLPLWAPYVLLCLLALIFRNERIVISPRIGYYLRAVADACFNPWAAPIYYLIVIRWLPYYAKMASLTYTRADGHTSFYVIPFVILSVWLYFAWIHCQHMYIKYFKPFASFDKELQPKFFSLSRIFGTAGFLLVTFPFSPQVQHILALQLLVGCVLASLGFLWRFHKAYKAPDSITAR